MRWLFFKLDPGGDLLSHTKYHAVPSAQKSLTTEFGMGSGVTSSLRPPRIALGSSQMRSPNAEGYTEQYIKNNNSTLLNDS